MSQPVCPNCGCNYDTAADLRRWKDGMDDDNDQGSRIRAGEGASSARLRSDLIALRDEMRLEARCRGDYERHARHFLELYARKLDALIRDTPPENRNAPREPIP